MDKKVTLELTVNQLNVILAGVIKLPIEAALETYTEVQKQAQRQLGDQPNPQVRLNIRLLDN